MTDLGGKRATRAKPDDRFGLNSAKTGAKSHIKIDKY